MAESHSNPPVSTSQQAAARPPVLPSSTGAIKRLTRDLYFASGKLGFITRDELLIHLGLDEDEVNDDDLDQLIPKIALHPSLPYDYMYVEPSSSGQLANGLITTLSVLGPLHFDELYAASHRYCGYRSPGVVHPPREVLRAFLKADDRFQVATTGLISVVEPIPVQLGRVQQWLIAILRDATGNVMKRAELLDLARQSGISASSIGVYCTSERFFKPLGSGLVTLTGISPSDDEIELATLREKALTVSTTVDSYSVSENGRIVNVVVVAGTDLSNQGYWCPREPLNSLVGSIKYSISVNQQMTGMTSYFGSTSRNWSPSMKVLEAVPGDLLEFRFDLESASVSVKKVVASVFAVPESSDRS